MATDDTTTAMENTAMENAAENVATETGNLPETASAASESEAAMETPSISVIIPTLNRGAQIAISAVKLQAQLRTCDELIIVDQTENPDDEVRRLYRELLKDSRVSIYFSTKKSSGQARNTGAFFSHGAVLLFWDDDLEPQDDLLEKHRAYYTNPRVGGVVGCYLGNYVFIPKGKREAWNFAAGHISLRREIFFKVGGFDTNLIYPFIPEDYELHTRLAAKRVHLVPARDCAGDHANVVGISHNSLQSDAWYGGNVHNHFYLIWRNLWCRCCSPRACFVVMHTLLTLFRYMFPLKLMRYRNCRRLFWSNFGAAWKTFRRVKKLEVQLPENETTLPWAEKFPEESEGEKSEGKETEKKDENPTT